jgi:hypothetical protein
MSKQKPGSSTQKKPERVITSKTPPASTGINSMMNWLLVLIVILPFLYSETPLDTGCFCSLYFSLCLYAAFCSILFCLEKKNDHCSLSPG